MGFGWTIVAMIAVLAIAWRFLGSYMAAVFEGRVRWLSFVERVFGFQHVLIEEDEDRVTMVLLEHPEGMLLCLR